VNSQEVKTTVLSSDPFDAWLSKRRQQLILPGKQRERQRQEQKLLRQQGEDIRHKGCETPRVFPESESKKNAKRASSASGLPGRSPKSDWTKDSLHSRAMSKTSEARSPVNSWRTFSARLNGRLSSNVENAWLSRRLKRCKSQASRQRESGSRRRRIFVKRSDAV
jgi:hypothetical protein